MSTCGYLIATVIPIYVIVLSDRYELESRRPQQRVQSIKKQVCYFGCLLVNIYYIEH